MAADVHQLEIIGTAAGQLVANVLHFQGSSTNSATPQADSQDLVTMWVANIENEWINCLPNDYSIIGYKSKRVNNGGGPSYIRPVTALNGVRPGLTTATQVSVGLISPYFSSLSTKPRWRVSKIFLPAMAADDIIDNKPAATLQLKLAALSLKLGASHGTSITWKYCVWSRKFLLAFAIGTIELGIKLYTLKKRLVPTL